MDESKTDEPKEVEKKELFELCEIATEKGIFIRDVEKDEVLDTNSALVKILNELATIKKLLTN